MQRYIEESELIDGRVSNDPVVIAVKCAKTADVVEVVRCKNCKHHEDEEPGMVYCPNYVGGWVSEEFFCADGERIRRCRGTLI